MRCRRIMAIALLLSMGSTTLWAVGTTGTIVGTVTDPTGAVVPRAKVIIRNQNTNATREAETNELGGYSVPLLPPGTYELRVEASGFSLAVHKNITVAVEDTVRVDVGLQIGDVAQEIIVTEAPALLQTDTSTLGQVIDRQKVEELPLNARNFLDFALLVPGAQIPSDGSQNSTQGGSISVNGAREQSNNFLLDGVDNNDLAINQYTVLPSVDAIQEFKVQSSNSSAEFGRSGGAQINVVLKSGTNNFHGTVFEFTRNRNLDARNFFDPKDQPIPRFDRNQFGGTIGGPIKRDKAFFFFSYEGLRLRQATTRVATVPSLAEKSAALAAVPAADRDPAGVAVFNLYPDPNVPGDPNGSVATPIIRNEVNQYVVRIDYLASSKDTISGHYALFDEDRFNPYDPLAPFTNLPGFGSFTLNTGTNIRLSWTRAYTPRLVQEARFGFNRLRGGIFQENFGTSRSQELGFPDVLTGVNLGFPNVVAVGFDGIGEPTNLPQDRHDNTFHYVYNLAWNPSFNGGRHQFKFGSDIRRFQLNFFLNALARGLWVFGPFFTGDTLQDLLRGLPIQFVGVEGDTTSEFRTTAVDFYVQDDIRVNDRFTLNLGLRYEFNQPPFEQRSGLSVPDLSNNSITCTPQPDCQFIIAGTGGVPRSTFEKDSNNLAPRLGFAWRPFANDRFVVRSGYGIFYDVQILNLNIFPKFNPPFFKILAVVDPTGTLGIQGIASATGSSGLAAPSVIDRNFKDGYLQHWNLNAQYEVLRDLLLDVAYVGSKGTSLTRQRDINQPRPGQAPPFSQFSDITLVEPTASSNYHAFQFRGEKRFSHGLTFLASYTWSKSIDGGSALFGTAVEGSLPQDSQNLGAERGLSNFHTKHRFVLSYLYQLPFGSGQRWLNQGGAVNVLLGGWQLGGIASLQSGRPFTVNRDAFANQSATDLGNGTADRPDLIADPFTAGPVAANPDPLCQLTVSQGGLAADVVRDPSSWFNPCAFAAAPGRFGNAGRNFLIGPNLRNWDFSILKDIPLGSEARRLQFRAEFFNLLNRPNFDVPSRSFDAGTFGAVLSSNAFGNKPPRQIQFGLKFIF